ncbi:MAG: hypothetical protein ACLSU9_10840 [Anaerovoracaceae bacterium]
MNEQRTYKEVIKNLLKKHNEKALIKEGFTRCTSCKNLIHKDDNYCQFCGRVKLKRKENAEK